MILEINQNFHARQYNLKKRMLLRTLEYEEQI